MKKHFKNTALCCAVLLLSIACNSEVESIEEVNTATPPGISTLIYPENNTECNEGNIISETENEVLFQWMESTNTNSYILTLTNLNEGTSREIKTISNEFLIRMKRGAPYAWSVKSENYESSKTVSSETWKFYNAGLPVKSHPPFPAEAISPQIGIHTNAGATVLQWQATDIDNDIVSYTILCDTANPPVEQLGKTSATSMVKNTEPETVYYWKIITQDALQNISDSPIFEFKTNQN